MILTCPACDTKYVVKDGAIPPAGRQVRCASCKHSWHQEPEPALAEQESVAVDFGGPPPADPDLAAEPAAEPTPAEPAPAAPAAPAPSEADSNST